MEVQSFGGMGLCEDLPIERYDRDAGIYRIFDRASEVRRFTTTPAAMKNDRDLFDIAL